MVGGRRRGPARLCVGHRNHKRFNGFGTKIARDNCAAAIITRIESRMRKTGDHVVPHLTGTVPSGLGLLVGLRVGSSSTPPGSAGSTLHDRDADSGRCSVSVHPRTDSHHQPCFANAFWIQRHRREKERHRWQEGRHAPAGATRWSPGGRPGPSSARSSGAWTAAAAAGILAGAHEYSSLL